MLLVGAAVGALLATHRAGWTGNVLPYGILQGYSVVILLFIAALFPRGTRTQGLIYAASRRTPPPSSCEAY